MKASEQRRRQNKRTAPKRADNSSETGTWYGIALARMTAFARTMRWASVAGVTRNARAISSVVRPHISRRVSATCPSGTIQVSSIGSTKRQGGSSPHAVPCAHHEDIHTSRFACRSVSLGGCPATDTACASVCRAADAAVQRASRRHETENWVRGHVYGKQGLARRADGIDDRDPGAGARAVGGVSRDYGAHRRGSHRTGLEALEAGLRPNGANDRQAPRHPGMG